MVLSLSSSNRFGQMQAATATGVRHIGNVNAMQIQRIAAQCLVQSSDLDIVEVTL